MVKRTPINVVSTGRNRPRASRRSILIGLASTLLMLPIPKLARIERAGFVERGGWILKRSDVE